MATPAALTAVLRAARPSFRGPGDALVFALHAAALAEGLLLTAVGECASAAPPPPSAPASPPPQLPPAEVPIDGWQQAGNEAEWALRYARPSPPHDSVLLSALLVGDTLHVDVAPPPPGEVAHCELSVSEFTDGSSVALPSLPRLCDAFASRIAPSLTGKPPPPAATAGAAAQQQRRRTAAQQEEEAQCASDVARLRDWPQQRGGGGGGSGPAPRVGDADRFPPGMPFLPPLGGGGGIGVGGEGMLVGPRNPAFIGGGGGIGGGEGGGFPGGGARPSGLPDGARFDPFGPPGVPGFEPGRFGGERPPPGMSPQPPGMHPPGRGVHPDIMPPGGDDDDGMM